MNTVYLQDFISGAKSLPSETFDVIICDPPYNIGKNFGNNKTKKELVEYLDWCDTWMKECIRLLNNSGTMYIYGFPEICAHISVRLPLEHRWLTWHYTNKNSTSASFWVRSQETILTAWKDKTKRIFNVNEAREPYNKAYLKLNGKKRAATPGRLSNGMKNTTYSVNPLGAFGRDVIKIPALAGGAGASERIRYCKTCNEIVMGVSKKLHKHHALVEHPTQKPARLTKKLLKVAMPSTGGQVLVPFAGTGAEIKVASELGLKAVGFDINPEYVTMGNALLASDLKILP